MHSSDIVHAHMCIVHLQNPAKALAEFYRVCKPGGIIATRDPAPDMQALALRFKPDVPGLREVMTSKHSLTICWQDTWSRQSFVYVPTHVYDASEYTCAYIRTLV